MLADSPEPHAPPTPDVATKGQGGDQADDLLGASVASPTPSLQECWPPTAASLPPLPPSVDGSSPVATTSSLGKDWGVIRP